jgi:hypothetical protein
MTRGMRPTIDRLIHHYPAFVLAEHRPSPFIVPRFNAESQLFIENHTRRHALHWKHRNNTIHFHREGRLVLLRGWNDFEQSPMNPQSFLRNICHFRLGIEERGRDPDRLLSDPAIWGRLPDCRLYLGPLRFPRRFSDERKIF